MLAIVYLKELGTSMLHTVCRQPRSRLALNGCEVSAHESGNGLSSHAGQEGPR